MQPLHPVENREADYVTEYKQRPGAEAVVVLVIIVALLVGAIFLAGSTDTSDAPAEPAPTDAPLDPGA